MLVIDIMMKAIQRDEEKRLAQQQSSGLGSFDIQMGKPANGYLPISIGGGLPSASTTIAKQLSSIALGYGMGRGLYGKERIKGFGKRSSLVETASISTTAAITAMLLEYYLYSNYFGTQLPRTSIELPVKMQGESDEQYRERGRAWVERQKRSDGLEDSFKGVLKGLAGAIYTDFTIRTLTALAAGYHGYKRHRDSIGMMLGWALFGNIGLAAAQGYAKPLPPRKK